MVLLLMLQLSVFLCVGCLFMVPFFVPFIRELVACSFNCGLAVVCGCLCSVFPYGAKGSVIVAFTGTHLRIATHHLVWFPPLDLSFNLR